MRVVRAERVVPVGRIVPADVVQRRRPVRHALPERTWEALQRTPGQPQSVEAGIGEGNA